MLLLPVSHLLCFGCQKLYKWLPCQNFLWYILAPLYVTGNRPVLLVFTRKLFIFRQSVGLHYTILQNTFQYFCRIPSSIFAEYLSVVLQKTSQFFFQNKSQYFFRVYFCCLTEHHLYFFEIMSQYFCITSPNIFKNPFSNFTEHVPVCLQSTYIS